MIHVFGDVDLLSAVAADRFVELARNAAAEHRRFAVALAGGTTPGRTYEMLVDPAKRYNVPWEAVHIFWGDERYVPPDDERSNARMARCTLLDHVPIPREQVHPIPFLTTPEKSARRYEAELRAFFRDGEPRFDLVLLGLGENGHTASLFPYTDALEETRAWVVAVHPTDDDLDRVTLTAPILNRAATILFLVAGSSKASILSQVLEGPIDPRRYPAQLINPLQGELVFYLDREAAAQLKPGHATPS